MPESSQPIVVEFAKTALAGWSDGPNESEQTKSAQKISRDWQTAVITHFGTKRFSKDYPVDLASGKQRFELVDREEGIVYELKVSSNNPNFEVYRNIFKVAVHNQAAQASPLKKLVFIVPAKGADALPGLFLERVGSIAKAQLGFEIEIMGV